MSVSAVLPRSGAYVIAYRLDRDVALRILGRRWPLAAGLYLYVGRSTRAFGSRFVRQLAAVTTIHWHIDHLKAAGATAVAAWLFDDATAECELARGLCALPGGEVPIRRFGAGDCVNGCAAHLVAWPGRVRVPGPVSRVLKEAGGRRLTVAAIRSLTTAKPSDP